MQYVKDKIPACWGLLNDDRSATHMLYLKTLDTIPIAIHDIIFKAQCLNFRQVAIHQALRNPLRSNPRRQNRRRNQRRFRQNTPKAKPSLLVKDIPDIQSFLELLKWLKSNNVRELYERLRRNEGILLGFAQNCRFWGVIDPKVIAVFKMVVEENSTRNSVAKNLLLEASQE